MKVTGNMSDAHLPTGWSDLLNSIRPFGESDLQAVLSEVGRLLSLEAAQVVQDDETLVRIGGLRDLSAATTIELEHSGTRLRALRAAPFDDGELRSLHALCNVLDLALLTPDRRIEQVSSPMIAPMGARDRLTNTIDRDGFVDYLDIEFAAGPSAASVIVLGLDALGVVNDTLGHTAGDVVLAEVADRLRATLRSCDIVSRLGGDVFGIYCPGMDVEIATTLTRRLQAAISAPVTVGSSELRVTASAGIATRAKGEKAASTLSHGDLALQSAKATGADSLAVFDGELQERIEDRRVLASELVDALAQNQLSTSMEPIVHLPDGSVVGVEARVVWNHPERGLIDRDEFIDLAELIGRVSDVERAVLEFALQTQETSDRPIRMGVTLSGSTLRDPLAIDWVIERLQSTDGHVIVEVSETAVSGGGAAVTEHLARLREAGASIVLDDFGVSLASMRTLHAYAFDGVKLHNALVAEGDARRGLAVVRAVYASAAVIGFDVVHTGIDTDEELGKLLSMAKSITDAGVFAQGQAVRSRATALAA